MTSPTNKIEAELRRLNAEWVEGLVKGDIAALDRTMADDCSFIYPLEGDSKQQFIADVESGDLKAEAIKRENVEVRIHGHTAVVTSFDTSKWHYRGHLIEGYYRTIHVYAEREGKWQMVAIQACPIKI